MQVDSGLDLAVIGKVVKAHGIRGEIKISPYSGQPDDLLGFDTIFVKTGSATSAYTVEKCRLHKNAVLFQVEGVADRTAAEAMIGMEVWAEKRAMPELSPGEFYWHEIEGLEVVTDQGRRLGRATAIMETGANRVLVVTGTGNEYLIPMIADVVVGKDDDTGTFVISPLPGLLEMNEPDAF